MATVENRPSDAMRQARKRRNRWIAAAFFIFVALIITLESPLTRIRRIQVSGNGSIPVREVISDSALAKGMSLWEVNSSRINRLVEARQPLVQSVSVKTDFLQGIVHLSVAQKHVVALMDVSGKFYPLLNDGVIYNATGQAQGFSWPIVSSSEVQSVVNGEKTNDPNVALLCEAVAKVPQTLLSSVSELHLDNLGTVTVFLNNSFEIRARVDGFANQFSIGMTAVTYFVSKNYAPGVIDITGQPPYQYTPLASGGKAG